MAEPDLREVRKTVPNAKVDLIPYGTDTDYFYPVDVSKQPETLVFHSHLGYPPNIEAALEFANEIFPLIRQEAPNTVFHLVGANPGPKILELATRPGIKISANLPDLRTAVCSAGIYVCAIRYGTGLKSKMLEAMAMQMPIVGYHPGSTVGIDCVYGEHLLAATTPQSSPHTYWIFCAILRRQRSSVRLLENWYAKNIAGSPERKCTRTSINGS